MHNVYIYNLFGNIYIDNLNIAKVGMQRGGFLSVFF